MKGIIPVMKLRNNNERAKASVPKIAFMLKPYLKKAKIKAKAIVKRKYSQPNSTLILM